MINTNTIATLTKTIIAFTVADSFVPLIKSKVNANKIIKAGALINPLVMETLLMISAGKFSYCAALKIPFSIPSQCPGKA